jgi:uncharacterized protein involved in exopolysaccharide biosynthesis
MDNNKKLIGEEIDIANVLKILFKERKTIIISVAVSCVIGLVFAFTSPKEYETDVRLLIESNGLGANSLLSQIGNIAGLGNLGAAGMEALSPQLYPDLINSKPFLIDVLNMKVTDMRYDSTLRVVDFLDRHSRPTTLKVIIEYTVLLPFKIKHAISKNGEDQVLNLDYTKGPLVITKDYSDLMESLEKRISAEHDPTTNTIAITVRMQDPKLSAVVADSVISTLARYVTEYRTRKAMTDLEFVQSSYNDAQQQYLEAQANLAAYRDLNKNVVLASVQSKEQKLQADFNIAVSVYTLMAQQLEQAKIKVQESTPVFKIIEPSEIPIEKSAPITTLILVIMAFLGFLAGAGIILSRKLIDELKDKSQTVPEG